MYKGQVADERRPRESTLAPQISLVVPFQSGKRSVRYLALTRGNGPCASKVIEETPDSATLTSAKPPLPSPFSEEGVNDSLVDLSDGDRVFRKPPTKLDQEIDLRSDRRSGVPEAHKPGGEGPKVWPQRLAETLHCYGVTKELLQHVCSFPGLLPDRRRQPDYADTEKAQSRENCQNKRCGPSESA
jgi:hypothetical protein